MNTSYIVPSTNRHSNNYYSAVQHLSNRDGKMRKQSNQNGFQSWFPIFIIFSCSPDFVECRDGVTLFRCRSRQIMMQSIDYWLRSDYLYSDTLRREWQRWCPRSDYDDVAATMRRESTLRPPDSLPVLPATVLCMYHFACLIFQGFADAQKI